MSVSQRADTVLTAEVFGDIARFAYDEIGLTLTDEKRLMVQSRLRSRMRVLDVQSFETYRDLLVSNSDENEKRHLISALTTNVSHFFREPHHHDFLLRAIQDKMRKTPLQEPIRIWSAGCSNGQEPYSIAMHLIEALGNSVAERVRILATDIDPRVIAFAKAGSYSETMLKGLDAKYRERFFVTAPGGQNDGEWQMSEDVKSMVRFNELNLLKAWPMKKTFAAIFCRNVLIYFDQTTQDGLWPKFRKFLDPTGTLFLGHSERIQQPGKHGFSVTGPTTYAKVSNDGSHIG